LDTACNYPPDEILNPIIGKPNWQYIILWMLSNNQSCSWSELKEKVNRSTLSIYLSRLKRDGYVIKSKTNEYRITSKGREKYYEVGQAKRGGRKLSYPPKVILTRRNYDHWILWMVYNNNYCKWADFLEEPLSINQSSLSKNLNDLMSKNFVKKDEKEYKITQSGKSEYSKMLNLYDLDRQSILEEESKRITELTQKTLNFFTEFNIKERDIQFRFLNSVLKLEYSKIKNVLRNEEDFHKILLFLSFNHPDEYPKYVFPDDFSAKYNIKKTTLDYYIDEIVENQIYTTKFFKLEVPSEKIYYFQSDEEIEKMLRVITEEHIKKFTYLNKLFENSSDLILPLDMNSTVNAILDEVTQHVFHEELKNSLLKFLPEYINYLAYKIEKEKKLMGISGKLEGIIWQNIPEILQEGLSKTSQYQFIGENEMNYYLETGILEVLRHYLAKKPDSVYKKINQSLDEKKYGVALELVDSALKSGRKDTDLIIYKAMILSDLNRNKESIDFLNKHIKPSQIDKENPIYALYFFVMGFSSMTQGEYEKAFDIVDKGQKNYPDHPLIHALIALVNGYNHIYEFDTEREEGLNEIEVAIALDSYEPNKARYYQLRSQFLLESKNYDEALESIDSAIALSPKNLDFYNSKNRILMYYDKFDEVLDILEKLLDQFPEGEKNLKIRKAYILKEKKDLEAGLEIINELIEKYPEDNSLLLNKIYWLQYLDEKEIVIGTIEDLLEREPENGTFHDTYGEILMNFEEYEHAIEEFQKAIDLERNEWYINQTYIKLGICYKETGEQDLAIENLTKGKEFTNKGFYDIETKRNWLTIAELFLNEIAEMEADF
jgi:tetratricopeptide (TPR) repeat protein/Mn-dependent DtxR family transcriptional regulator